MPIDNLCQDVAQLPHHRGFRVTARVGDTFEMGSATYQMTRFSMGGYAGGTVTCKPIRGEVSEDLKPYMNPDKTIGLCADSVALFFYETILRRQHQPK